MIETKDKKIYKLGYYDYDGWREELYHEFGNDNDAIVFFTDIFNELKKITLYEKGYEIWDEFKKRFNDPELNISFAFADICEKITFTLFRLDPMTKVLQNDLNWTKIREFTRERK